MQTWGRHTLQECRFFLRPKKMYDVLKRVQGLFLINDKFLDLKSDQIEFLVQKVAQYSETNKKSIFRFLVFEIWSFKILRIEV